jgi:hypothetical protein
MKFRQFNSGANEPRSAHTEPRPAHTEPRPSGSGIAILALILLSPTLLPAQPVARPAAAATAAAVEPSKAAPLPAAKPFKPEALHYTINYASGLSLGDAYISSSKATLSSGEGLTFTLKADASIPGFKLQEMANSTTSTGFCSLDITKESQRGKKKVAEKTTFDARTLTATRETLNGGGKSDLSIGNCAKDALAYVFFIRRELSQGRLPAAQKVYYGAAYDVRPEFAGTQNIRLGEESVEADRLLGHIKGPKTDLTLEMFFSKEPARLPLMIRIPVAQGKISVELVR